MENKVANDDEINDICWLRLKIHEIKDIQEEKVTVSKKDYEFNYSPNVSKKIIEVLSEQQYTTFKVKIEKQENPTDFEHTLLVAQMAEVIEKPKKRMAIKINLEKYPASGKFVRYIADVTKDPVDSNVAVAIKYLLSLYLQKIKKVDRSPGSAPKGLTLSNGRLCICLTLGIILVLVPILVALISETFS